MTATVDQFLAEVRSHLGDGETAGRTRYGEWWGVPSMQWCAVFLAYCAARVDGLDKIVPRESYANQMIRWYQSQGRLRTQPRVGAVAGFDWSGGRSIDRIGHVSLIEAVHSDGTITTLGGNEDNRVMRRRRSTAYVVAYGYPVYGTGHPRTIRLGSTGETVKLLQRLLGVVADGVFGPLTEAAVRTFQRRHGLAVDGIVGPQTWTALGR